MQISSIERGLQSLICLQHVNLVRYLGLSHSLHSNCISVSVSQFSLLHLEVDLGMVSVFGQTGATTERGLCGSVNVGW